MEENKVISSKITRDYKPLKNDLYDLIKVKPAIPTLVSIFKEHNCDFQPITGKTFTPKKRIRFMKVKTVRDIRNLYESDISIDLPKDLEKQQNLLLKKITCGSSREENTKAIARNMLKYDKPVSRSSWQMIMNVNPEERPHAIQYVLWRGKRIRVNGSKGGKNKFLCNYDLSNIKIPLKNETKHKTHHINKGLLRNSLTVKFKPGPLTRKMSLDDSFQKYNVGKTELVNLPRPGLNIQSLYGVPLEPMIANFVQSLRDFDGTITEKWAEFAVSALGTVRNTEPVQDDNQSGVTFNLNYKRDQRRILLRRDVDNVCNVKSESLYAADTPSQIETDLSDVQNILKEIINSVEISLQQDNLYTGEDEPRVSTYEGSVNIHSTNKDNKSNKKRFCELDRLDVTVIRLPDVAEDNGSNTCKNAHCSLGCICASLQRSYNLKQHCGRLECMFDCQCDFTKYKVTDTFDSDCSELIPGLINLDNKLNSKLAKEEQKFHQTVVLTGEKSILLKSEKRNWKASKRYGDFYNNMCLKNFDNSSRVLSVADVKLNCENVEPWCMVHNLYKCFCKGKFTHQNNANTLDENDVNETISHDDETSVTTNGSDTIDKKTRRSERNSADRNKNKHLVSEISHIIDLDSSDYCDYTSCARSRPYKGRKYVDTHYFNANKKIMEMEKNDDHLRKRMLTILNKTEDGDSSTQVSSTSQSNNNILQVQDNVENNYESCSFENTNKAIQNLPSIERSNCDSSTLRSLLKDDITPDRSILNTSSNKTKLIAWLESSYKQYKQRIEQGIVKKSLDPPKHGKVALYPWEFILSRYRERKNLFLISQQKPFRIFMAVNTKNNFFENCLNIDDIRFADLHKYPVTVKNLLTNATDLKDNFCILCGLAICWELIGSVTKVDDQTNDTNQLQSVADDKKIGFVAQDSKKPFIKETSVHTDNNEINLAVNEDVQYHPLEQPDRKDTTQLKTKVKKRSRNFAKYKNSKRLRKNRWTTNYKEQIKATSLQGEQDSGSEETSLMTDANIICPTTHDLENVENNTDVNKSYDELSFDAHKLENMQIQEIPQDDIETEKKSSLQSSKWFVMTIENDFSEIKFFNRGFFVKYESIIKAINVARMSGKTVRLSKSKGENQTNYPQFGLYAIPNTKDFYVFIGPYDTMEPLGIETVKSFANKTKANSTRGVWITTKKVDNIKVIDNPLSFMPIDLLNKSKIVSLENEVVSNQPTDNHEPSSSNFLKDSEKTAPAEKLPLKAQAKVIKPIRIRKTSGFYQLAPRGLLSQVLPKPTEGTSGNNLLQPILLKNVQPENRTDGMPLLQLPVPKLYYSNTKQKPQSLLKTLVSDDRPQSSKPVAEIAPQIKIVDVYSETATRGNNQNVDKKPEVGMFILKPEEINKRLMENRLASNSQQSSNNVTNLNTTKGSELDQDIENFLATSIAYVPPNADIFEISDEDDDSGSDSSNWRNVWIECESAHLGYIKGKMNAENMLSFEFPGFKFTDFYPEEEAFSKINQVLSRKIYVPKSINLTWRVVESVDDLKRKYELKATCLGTDFVLTKRGIRHKALIAGNKSLYKTSSDTTETNLSAPDSKLTVEEVDDAIGIIDEMEEQSNVLEDEGQKLMTEMSKIDRASLLESLKKTQNEPQCSTEQREQLLLIEKSAKH